MSTYVVQYWKLICLRPVFGRVFLAAVFLSGSSQNYGKLKKFRGIVKTSAEERGAMHSLTMTEGVLEELINMLDGKNLHCVCIMLHVFGLSNILIDTYNFLSWLFHVFCELVDPLRFRFRQNCGVYHRTSCHGGGVSDNDFRKIFVFLDFVKLW